MPTETSAHLEENTRKLANRLHDLMRRYRSPARERRQEWLFRQMAGAPALRSRLLRFIDVLAASDGDPAKKKTLFREYFGAGSSGSSWPVRFALSLGRHPAFPAGVLRSASLHVMNSLADRFISGSDHDSITRILDHLERRGRSATISVLRDEVISQHEAEAFKARYLELIGILARWLEHHHGSPAPELSIKLTSLTDKFVPADVTGTVARIRPALEDIARRCKEAGLGLTLDAEQYEHREITWRAFSEVFGRGSEFGQWGKAGITVQSYFKDSAKYLETVLAFASERAAPFQVRLVKGAYWDYEVVTARQNNWPVPVFEEKEGTDTAFGVCLDALLRHDRIRVAVAGHSTIDHARAETLRESLGLAPDAIEHQTLFRTAEGVSRALRTMGWETRDYVPSGELVPGMGYLFRRIMENTSPEGFLMRSRSGESVASLMAPAPEPVRAAAQEDSAGFRNNPPKRLFLADERWAFESALKSTAAQWAGEYLLQFGPKTVSTVEVKTSLSPSEPDPDRPVGRVHMAGVVEVEAAVRLAREGFTRWSRIPPATRADVLLQASGRLSTARDTLAAWIVHEGGRTWSEALADVDEAADHFAYNARRLLECEERVQRDYAPRGVVAVIPPWNFPAALPAAMMSGALAAGNAVVLKSAEQTPVIAARLTEVLHKAGIPRDVLIHVPGRGDIAGDQLVGSDGVDMVAFTGSKAVGIAINAKASLNRPASGVKKTVAEMGGKNAIIVCEDADLDEAIKGIVLSAFEHANQKCSACSRVFIHRRVFAQLARRLSQAAAGIPVGAAHDPATLINPLIEQEAKDRVLAYAQMARREGRVIVDRVSTGSANPLQVGPLIVEIEMADLAGSTVARDEIFGPVLALIQFDNEDKMLAAVNGTAYALTAGIFSRSPTTITRLIRQVQAGNIYVNRKITGARVGIEPFGGFKLSGTGPKAGGQDYLFAFLTRHGEQRAAGPVPSDPVIPSMPPLARTIHAWPESVHRRVTVLRRAMALVETAVSAPALPDTLAHVLDSAREIATPEATIVVPGQVNFMDRRTPRGVGFVATDAASPVDCFAGMVFGPLLAGDGLVVAPHESQHEMGRLLVASLHRAGVPHSVLRLSTHGGPQAALALADDMFHFAVTDMETEETACVNERLAVTLETEGQTWVKALFSMRDCHRPGEPGFISQFTLPKTVAVRTLRLGADLSMPGFQTD